MKSGFPVVTVTQFPAREEEKLFNTIHIGPHIYRIMAKFPRGWYFIVRIY